MNEFFNTFQKQARAVKLSQGEKQAMRMHIYNMIDRSGALSATQKTTIEDFKKRMPTPSTPSGMPMPHMYTWFSPRFAMPLAVVLVVGLSGGTAFAAQSALPGDALYTVKINVNEKVVTALATTPQAKAKVNASLATTRLEEAETLASKGALDATTTAQLASNFAEHANAADANTAEVASVDPGTAAQLGATFSSTLAAHGAILAQLANNSEEASVHQNSDALAVQVLAKAEQGQTSRSEGRGAIPAATLAIATSPKVPAALSDTGLGDVSSGGSNTEPARAKTMEVRTFVASQASTSGEVPATTTTATINTPTNTDARESSHEEITSDNNTNNAVALALGAQASTTLGLVESDFATLAPKLDSATTLLIQAQIDLLKQQLATGNNALIGGDTESAQSTLNHVLRASVRLDAFLKAGQKFNASFLTSLLNN